MVTLTKAQYESLVNYIFTVADGAGNTKEEQREALEKISDLADPNTLVEETNDGEWQVAESEGTESDEDDIEDDDED